MCLIQSFLSVFFITIIFYVSFRILAPTREFEINKYLKLKLEAGRTNIYVKGRKFQQCMYLLLNIPVDRVEDYDEIESIDEAAEVLDRSMEGNHNNLGARISPEEEFQGHCSNIQVWVENGYDTRILHRNLAFPLLKRLSEVGDPMARKVFSEEIAIRLASNHPTVIQYLTQNGYLRYLNSDEFESILDDLRPTFLQDMTANLRYILEHNPGTDLTSPIDSLIHQLIRDFGIEHISLITSKILNEIPENYRNDIVKDIYKILRNRNKFPLIQYINKHLEYFEDFEFDYNFIKYEGKIVAIFRNDKIYLNNQNIRKISSLDVINDKLNEVKDLDLSNNQISDLRGIDKFSNVRVLKLNNNKITKIQGLENLKRLEKLFLRHNRITEIKVLKNLINLKHLDLSNNPSITEIPELLNELPALETIKLWNCNIDKYSESTEKIFWMNQNYRFFTGYNEDDKNFYENSYSRVALSDNKLYKKFVEWVLKMRSLMENFKFSYQDIYNFNEETSKNAIWSGRVTNDFKNWLDDKKYQTKITSFF
ncbi:MAG: leucine-rich repeat domain-containing protein [Candidatus Lokiarchaeota archaeon]|nr:leucine-rich repeat domain-containing protein [Candidatus Lokiarchaeota archaeon]